MCLDAARYFKTYVHHQLGQGDDGTAFLLGDGRVLRRTTSMREVAIALKLQEIQNKSLIIPGLPKIHEVFWMLEKITLGDICKEVKRAYIIREEMADIDACILAKNPSTWKGSLKCFNLGWSHNNLEYIDAAITEQPVLESLLETLVMTRNYLDITIVDLGRTSNLGLLDDRLGIRDFSRAHVPMDSLDHVEKWNFKEVQVSSRRTVKLR